MAVFIKENFMGAKNTDEAYINGLMEQLIVETGAIIKLMDMVLTIGQMAEDMKVNGGKINFIIEEFIHGQMDANMKVNTWMTRNMDGAFIYGLMVRSMKATGIMESNTVKENLLIRLARVESVFG